MFQLTPDDLDNAKAAIEAHGHGTLMPNYGEWPDLVAGWEAVRGSLCSIDLDTYIPHAPLRVFAPKSPYTMRELTILHPHDLLIYTALAQSIKTDVEAARVPVDAQRVFSFRVDASAGRLFLPSLHSAYRERLATRSADKAVGWVATADIADFYPRIYQHRLHNALASVATSQRTRDVARVLVEKFLMHLARGNSYGIPVGPIASRLLGEALLIDVDEALMSRGFDFVRWVDDISIFCHDEVEARRALHFLGWWLWDKHGLTLQATKTRATTVESYKSRVLIDKEARLKGRVEEGENEALGLAFEALRAVDPYADPWDVQLDGTETAAIEALELGKLLTEALSDEERPDYDLATFILDRAANLQGLSEETQQELASVVLQHADRLRPLTDRIGRFLIRQPALSAAVKGELGSRLAQIVMADLDSGPNEHFAVWGLAVLSSGPGWVPDSTLFSIYTQARSPVVKTYAAHALATVATRSQVLTIKDDFATAPPLLRLAILRCVRRLPADERNHWRRLNGVSSPLEKILSGVAPAGA